MKHAIAALLLTACVPSPKDFRDESQAPWILLCDEADGGVDECFWVEVIFV